MLFVLWFLIALIILVLTMFIFYYNRFVVMENRVDNSLSQIDVQLRKRADLVPNLINTVKGYVKHEKEVMKEVTEARKHLLSAKNLPGKMKAGAELQDALKSVFAIAENYPQLKANENFLQLQQELASIEERIAYSRQYYNDSILTFNNMCESFPGNLFAGVYGKKEKQYLKIPEESRAVPKVNF
ncbi:MAG: LemA family protein [Nanoarchaeota archaeon]